MAVSDSDYDRSNDRLSRLRPSSTRQVDVPVPSEKPDDMSTPRWHAALAVHKLKGLKPGSPSARLQADTDRCGPFPCISALAPRTANRVFGHLSSGDHYNWTLLKAGFLADGYRVALLQAIISILINHIRRTFVPWLGSYWFYHPMEDLRLALSNPHIFLEETVSYPWSWVLFSFLQRWAVDLSAYWMMVALLANNGRVPRSAIEKLHTSSKAVIISLEGLMHLCKIGLGVYMLMTLDYIFCRSTHTVSVVISVYKLATGRKADHLALRQLTGAFTADAALIVWMVACYLWLAFRPTTSHALMSALRGKPGLLAVMMAVVGSMWTMLRYRARLYILLEMNQMFIVLGALFIAVVLLAREFVDDPLGLKVNAVVTRMREREAKESEAEGRKATEALPSQVREESSIYLSRVRAPIR